MKKLLSTLFISSALLFVGCEGDEGPQGPAGPTGNANVKSTSFRIAPDDLTQTSQNYFLYYYSSSILNSDLYNNGVIHTYYKISKGNAAERWLSLPANIGFPQGNLILRSEHYAESPDSLLIWVEPQPVMFADTIDMKVVAIDGQAAKFNPTVDFGNYEMVKEYFGLED